MQIWGNAPACGDQLVGVSPGNESAAQGFGRQRRTSQTSPHIYGYLWWTFHQQWKQCTTWLWTKPQLLMSQPWNSSSWFLAAFEQPAYSDLPGRHSSQTDRPCTADTQIQRKRYTTAIQGSQCGLDYQSEHTSTLTTRLDIHLDRTRAVNDSPAKSEKKRTQ